MCYVYACPLEFFKQMGTRESFHFKRAARRLHKIRVPCYKLFMCSQLKSCENVFCSGFHTNWLIRPHFCTCHDSSTVVVCTKLWLNWIAVFLVIVTLIFRGFCIWAHMNHVWDGSYVWPFWSNKKQNSRKINNFLLHDIVIRTNLSGYYRVKLLQYNDMRSIDLPRWKCILFDRSRIYHSAQYPWWLHQMETFSALLVICAGNSTVPGDAELWCFLWSASE